MLNPQLLKKIREDPGGLVGSIEYLDLSSSNLGPTDLQLLTKALSAHPNNCGGVCSPIIGINLSNNNLCDLHVSVDSSQQTAPDHKPFQGLCKCIQGLRYIRLLNLSENTFGPPGIRAICELLETTSSLHELNLSCCPTTPQTMIELSNALTKNKSITLLDLTQTKLSPEGLESLMTALSETYRSEIKTLLIGGNNLGPLGAKKLSRALQRPPRALIAINAESNRFGDIGMKSICRALRVNKSVQHLDLSDNAITQECGTDIAIALTRNSTLIFLSVAWNQLNSGGLLNIVPGLQNNITLAYLNIIGNGAGPDVGTALVEASLLSNLTPVDIDIDYLPPRSRQDILQTDTKTVFSTDDAADEEMIDAAASGSRPSSAISPPPKKVECL